MRFRIRAGKLISGRNIVRIGGSNCQALSGLCDIGRGAGTARIHDPDRRLTDGEKLKNPESGDGQPVLNKVTVTKLDWVQGGVHCGESDCFSVLNADRSSCGGQGWKLLEHPSGLARPLKFGAHRSRQKVRSLRLSDPARAGRANRRGRASHTRPGRLARESFGLKGN